MHELSIMTNVVSIVSEQARNQQVVRVRIEIGRLAAVIPESLRFCFDVCTKDTNLEGATLEIVEIAPRGKCKICEKEFDLDMKSVICPCGSREVNCIAGEELKIVEMEVE